MVSYLKVDIKFILNKTGFYTLIVVKNLLPTQPGFRVLSDPDHKVSQQPPLTVPAIIMARLQHRTYKGLVSSASLIGGMPLFLYLFARVSKNLINEKNNF